MRLVGFNFTKINAEKLADKLEGLKISTNIDISEIHDVKSGVFKIKEELVGVKFTYAVNYEPDYAKIELAGNVLLAIDSKVAKEILKQWKDKKIANELKLPLFNIILKKSNLKSLQLEEELNLPLHIPMPSLKPEQVKDEKPESK